MLYMCVHSKNIENERLQWWMNVGKLCDIFGQYMVQRVDPTNLLFNCK